MAAFLRFPAPPRVRRRACSPRAVRLSPGCGLEPAAAPDPQLAGRAGATPVDRPSSRLSAGQRARRVLSAGLCGQDGAPGA